MIFAIARELGMTAGEVRARMPSHEIVEWLAFFSLENEERENRTRDAKAQALATSARRSIR